MNDELKERVKALAVEAGFDADNCEITAPWSTITGDPMDVTEQVTKLIQAVARDCSQMAGKYSGTSAALMSDEIRARYGITG